MDRATVVPKDATAGAGAGGRVGAIVVLLMFTVPPLTKTPAPEPPFGVELLAKVLLLIFTVPD